MNESNPSHDAAKTTALEQFGHVMSYLQYENSMYWERSNFFMVASTALFGFMATNLLPLGGNLSWEKILPLLIVSVAGGTLTRLWHLSLRASEHWIDHWHEILRKLEPQSFGEISLFRDLPPDKGGAQRIRIRSVATYTLLLFYVLWGMAVFYSLITVGMKLCASR